MLRGTIKFKCDICGHVLEGLDIEDRMTAAAPSIATMAVRQVIHDL